MNQNEQQSIKLLSELRFAVGRARNTIREVHCDFEGLDPLDDVTLVEAKSRNIFTGYEFSELGGSFEKFKKCYLIVNDTDRDFLLFRLIASRHGRHKHVAKDFGCGHPKKHISSRYLPQDGVTYIWCERCGQTLTEVLPAHGSVNHELRGIMMVLKQMEPHIGHPPLTQDVIKKVTEVSGLSEGKVKRRIQRLSELGAIYEFDQYISRHYFTHVDINWIEEQSAKTHNTAKLPIGETKKLEPKSEAA